jgi:hypothetical protein
MKSLLMKTWFLGFLWLGLVVAVCALLATGCAESQSVPLTAAHGAQASAPLRPVLYPPAPANTISLFFIDETSSKR